MVFGLYVRLLFFISYLDVIVCGDVALVSWFDILAVSRASSVRLTSSRALMTESDLISL